MPGKVSFFNASSYSVFDGTSINLSWGKPSGYSGTVKYNFYITKPGDRRWRYKTLVSSTSLNRYMTIVGTHKFEVEACNTDGQCGTPISLNVTVNPPVPSYVSSFTATSYSVIEGETITINWSKPTVTQEPLNIIFILLSLAIIAGATKH